MEHNARARDQLEQSAIAGQPLEPVCGHRGEDWPDLLTEPCELGHDELGLLQGKVAGHRWDGWRRLTGDGGYVAACSCGWHGTEMGEVSPMLRQVKEHLDAVRAVRGRIRVPPKGPPSRAPWCPKGSLVTHVNATKEDYADVALEPAFAGRPFLAYDAPGCGETSCEDLPGISSRSWLRRPRRSCSGRGSSASSSSGIPWAALPRCCWPAKTQAAS